MLRTILRRLIQPVLWLGYRFYNRRDHVVHMDGLALHLAPGVFHPRWFLTTRTIAQFALGTIQEKDRVLELGAGNGFLALSCSRAGASVMASDINPAAVASIQRSALENKLQLEVIHSDLFDSIPQQVFDYIFINPPFFP